MLTRLRRLQRLAVPLPWICSLCHEPAAGRRICSVCIDRLTPNRSACSVCAVPVITSQLPATCDACSRRRPSYESATVPWIYTSPLNHLIGRCKFRAERAVGIGLGEALADSLADALVLDAAAPAAAQQASSLQNRALVTRYGETDAVARALPDVVVPMPIAAARLRRRGFNQAELIARVCASRFGLPLRTGLLQRCAEAPPQTGQSRQRRLDNTSRLIRVAPDRGRSVAVAGQRVLLVDDVMTTGATCEAAARCLCALGASSVQVAAVARSSKPQPEYARHGARHPERDRS